MSWPRDIIDVFFICIGDTIVDVPNFPTFVPLLPAPISIDL